MKSAEGLVSVAEASRTLGVSVSTVWRLIRRGGLPSVRQAGRRLIPARALSASQRKVGRELVPALTEEHPIFRLIGAGRSGGKPPGARDKHAVLERAAAGRRR